MAWRLGNWRHKSRAAPLRNMRQFVRQQSQGFRRVGRVSAAKRNRAAVGERIGMLRGRGPLCHRPAIDTHARRIDARERVQQRSRGAGQLGRLLLWRRMFRRCRRCAARTLV